MSLEQEWKTMRVSAVSYYKLIDLGNLFSLAMGRKLAASDVLDLLINSYYPIAYSNLIAVVQDPEKLEKVRKEINGQFERLEKLWKELK